MKVLIVESPGHPHQALETGLAGLGYAIDRVADGETALERAAACDYDVIVLDLRLPSESSLLVLHEIRETDRRVDILVLAARNQIHDRVTALIQGADDYLLIPVSAAQLHARIERLARRREDSHPGSPVNETGRRVRHLDRLIANLLQWCNPETGAIEQVISEVRLASLLERLRSQLEEKSAAHGVELQIDDTDTPVLLADASWLEKLLTHLVYHLISICPPGDCIRIAFERDGDYGSLAIASSADAEPDLSLIRGCARHLNLEVTQLRRADSMLIRISKLRIF